MEIIDKLKARREEKKEDRKAYNDELATVRKGFGILEKYKDAKTNLNNRIISNHQWFKLRHWPEVEGKKVHDAQPVSAWLLNSIVSKHADAMDNYPQPVILPREQGDVKEAETLSDILPLVLEQNDFIQTYNDAWWDKLEFGTCVFGVFWDNNKLNGLGDISIKLVDILSIYWEPGISDIQDSKNVFIESLVDLEELKAAYPNKNFTAVTSSDVKEYHYNDNVPKDGKVQVVDWYYKKRNSQGKQVLHLTKFCQGAVLFETEKDEKFAESGLYDHAMYPFVIDRIYPEKGTLAGFGPIDIMKSPQEYIDKLNQALLKNAMVNARPRFFVRDDAAINAEEFADIDKDFITVHGNLDDSGIKAIVQTQLPPIYMSLLESKIAELKETSGNWDVSNGGTTSGATAASAIAALQEASGKGSRDMNKSAYRAVAKIYSLCIELIRQFYDEPRTFRITGEDGTYQFREFSNVGLKSTAVESINGEDMFRTPSFDIKVQAEKASVYSTLSQNELAKEFFSAGFFNPQISDQALACVEMMQFEGKEQVIKKIGQNGTLLQQVQQLQQQLLSLSQAVEMMQPGSGVADAVAGQILGSNNVQATGSTNIDTTKGSLADQARARSQSAATPR